MVVRFTVIGLVVLNIFLWGWAAIQPKPQSGPASKDPARITQIGDLPVIRLASEATRLPPGGSVASRRCYSLGPIASRSAMRSIQDELARDVVQLSWHETSAVVEQGYWVYLEPFGSYEQAAEAVDQLVAQGVRDYYLMPRGPYANAVSVGLYEQRSQAQARQEEIEALGLGWPVAVEMQRKDEVRYWLDFEISGDSDIEVDSVTAHHSGAQHLEVPCPENQASFPPT